MKIQIFIDTVCGWCFIGSQRLISSIQELNKDFEIIYVPFQLNPDMPKQGMNRAEYVQKKFGSLENAKPMYDNMVLEAQKENLQFKLSSIAKTPNTVPLPPKKLAPPIMHAAIASNSAFNPALGYPESVLPAKINAPNPANNPHSE